jgi:hypothetical protein
MPYPEAALLAAKSAQTDSENLRRHLQSRSSGRAIGEPMDEAALGDPADQGNNAAAPQAPLR